MFGPPSIEDITLQYTMEFDPNSPRLRISVIAYLLENGFDPSDLGFYTMADELVQFISNGKADFIVAVEAALPALSVAEDSTDNAEEDYNPQSYL